MLAAVLFALLVLASAQPYDITLILTQDCGTGPVAAAVIGYKAAAASGTCTATCGKVGATYYYTQCAQTGFPSIPDPGDGRTVLTSTVWFDDSCGGTGVAASQWNAILSNTCVDYPFGTPPTAIHSSAATCSPGSLATWDSNGCDSSVSGGTGNGTKVVDADTTQSCYLIPMELGGGSGRASCYNSVCFHKDTEITYGEQKMNMKAIEKHDACAIPHIVKTDGIKIETTCDKVLRLTRDHLVYTQDGMKIAGSVKVGDFLYNDLTEKRVCEVTGIKAEHNQEYFGLNCEDSIVLANGYKTSTFGVTHDLPAIWMRYASKVFGINAASSFGDMVANLLKSWGFF